MTLKTLALILSLGLFSAFQSFAADKGLEKSASSVRGEIEKSVRPVPEPAEKPEKPERPVRDDKPQKPERPERPEKAVVSEQLKEALAQFKAERERFITVKKDSVREAQNNVISAKKEEVRQQIKETQIAAGAIKEVKKDQVQEIKSALQNEKLAVKEQVKEAAGDRKDARDR